MSTTDRDSGAGAYSNTDPVFFSVAMSLVQGEVVGAGVAAGTHLRALHEQVVEQGGRAEAEPVRVQPVRARDLVDGHEVPDRVLAGADPTGGLHTHHLTGRLPEVTHRLEHHQGHRERRRRLHLPGGRLDEVRAGGHRQPRRTTDVVVRRQLTGLADHLQVRAGLLGPLGAFAGLADGDDLVVHVEVAAGQERAAVDHHVYLVGPRLDGVLGVRELHVERCASGRERGGDAGDAYPTVYP